MTLLGFVMFSSNGESFFLRFCRPAKSQVDGPALYKLRTRGSLFGVLRVFSAVRVCIFYVVEKFVSDRVTCRELTAAKYIFELGCRN